MSDTWLPYTTVVTSASFYGLILRGLRPSTASNDPTNLQRTIKAISASHAVFTTILALDVLKSSKTVAWPLSKGTIPNNTVSKPALLPDDNLDDGANPLITLRTPLGNFLTAWEAGYLIYDTLALAYEVKACNPKESHLSAARRLCGKSPAVVVHHLALIASLSYLQTYIAKGREKGVLVIVAFLLMNASSPLLHARWWQRKKHGRSSVLLDWAVTIVFAVCRLGTVGWVLKKYGEYHGLDTWQVYRRLRVPCQVGTASLVALNGAWWAMLLARVTGRTISTRATSTKDG